MFVIFFLTFYHSTSFFAQQPDLVPLVFVEQGMLQGKQKKSPPPNRKFSGAAIRPDYYQNSNNPMTSTLNVFLGRWWG